MKNNPWVLVVDFEATCSNDGQIGPEAMEIIEIGACWARQREGHAQALFQTCVRPEQQPRLTTFCRQLTGIEQTMVDHAPTAPAALRALHAFAQLYADTPNAWWGSWGQWDARQLAREQARHALPFTPLSPLPHRNIKPPFCEVMQRWRGVDMRAAISAVGLEWIGAHHRGLDDARNIARLLPWLNV